MDPAVPAVPGDLVKDRRVVLALGFQRAGVGRGRRPRAAGVFPLGFRRKRERKVDLFKVKLFIDFLNKLPTVFPAHILHRPIRRLELTRVLAHQRFPERLGARCVKHPEAFGDRDLVLWSFVRVSPFLVGRRTHQEPTGGDPSQALADLFPEAELRPQAMAVAADGRGPGWASHGPQGQLVEIRNDSHRDDRGKCRLNFIAPGQVQAPGSARRLVVSAGLRPPLRLTRHSLHPACWTWTPELGTAEAQAVAPARGPGAVAARRSRVLRAVTRRAAPDHAGGGRSTLACAILPVRVGTPLPYVAQHVVETPTVGLLQGNRMGLSATVLGVPGNLVQVSIARCRRSGPARVLPLFLRGKPQPQAGDHRRDPGQEGLRVVPAHMLHGAGWPAEAAWVLAHHRFPESLGARRLEHPEAALDRDLMLRALVIPSSFLVIGRAHEELARRNPAQLLRNAANLERRPSPERISFPVLGPLRSDPARPECPVRLDLDQAVASADQAEQTALLIPGTAELASDQAIPELAEREGADRAPRGGRHEPGINVARRPP